MTENNMFTPLSPEEQQTAQTPADETWHPDSPVPGNVPPAPLEHGKLGKPVARHVYKDSQGRLLGYIDRFEPKAGAKIFLPMRHGTLNGVTAWHRKGWPGNNKPLYGLHKLKNMPGARVLIVEGEKTADAAQALFPDYIVLTPMNGAQSPHNADFTPLKGKTVIIWPDHDLAGKQFADVAAESLWQAGAQDVRRITVPETFPEKWDLADPPPPDADITAMLHEAEPVPEPLDHAVSRLAALAPLEYDRARQEEAKKLGVRATTLDKEVEKTRKSTAPGEEGRKALHIPEAEPWPEPVDGDYLLTKIRDTLNAYVALPIGAAEVMAAWVVYTYVFKAFLIGPRLAVSSPEKRCSKTTTMNLLQQLVCKPLPSSNITPAALFRTIEKVQPTLLIDEADTFLRDSDELRGILNSGHNRLNAFVIRTVGDDHEPMQFTTWSPVVIALIGTLHNTLEDRCIVIQMRRKRRDEYIRRFRMDQLEEFAELSSQIARWAEDHFDILKNMDPDVPQILHDRAADNWRPLLAVADLIGSGWPEVLRKSAETLCVAEERDEDGSARVLLLTDIQAIFKESVKDRMPTAELIDHLMEMDHRPWPEWSRGKPITARGIAKLLRPFGLKSKTIRLLYGKTPKGYILSDFKDAFARYLPHETATAPQTSDSGGLPIDPRRHTPAPVADENALYPAENQDCGAVALNPDGSGPPAYDPSDYGDDYGICDEGWEE